MKKEQVNTNKLNRKTYLDARMTIIDKHSGLNFEHILDTITKLIETFSNEDEKGEIRLTYESFCTIRQIMKGLVPEMLSTSTFIKLYTGNDDGSISAYYLLSYCNKSLFVFAFASYLHSFDSNGTGFIKHDDFIKTLLNIEEIQSIHSVLSNENLSEFYERHLSAYVTYLLEPYKGGDICIMDVVNSPIPEMIYDLIGARDILEYDDEDNWLSYIFFIDEHECFQDLMGDDLRFTDEVLRRFICFVPSAGFISRFLELTKNNIEPDDYEYYVILLNSWDDLLAPQSLKFFFDLFDTNGDGYVDAWDLLCFYKAGELCHIEPPNNYNYTQIINLIFDIVVGNNGHPRKFNLLEFSICKEPDYIINLLVDSEALEEMK